MIIKSILEKYLELINSIVQNSEFDNLSTLFKHLENSFESQGRIFLAGNGGSAAIANHAATDLSKLTKNNNLLNPISLPTNIAQITANANDDGYENIFVSSVKNYQLNPADLVIVISSSGNSKNIINLIEYSKEKAAKTFAFLGFDGGKAKEIVDFPILINSKKGYYGPVEDIHMIIFHLFAHIIKSDIDELDGK